MARYLETAADVNGQTIKRSDVVVRAAGNDYAYYRVLEIVETDGRAKLRIKRLVTDERFVSWVQARSMRRTSDTTAARIYEREAARKAEMGRRIEGAVAGGIADAIRNEKARMERAIQSAPASQWKPAECPVATAIATKVASVLDRPIVERYAVEILWMDRLTHHAVIDTTTGEVVEQFTERDMARDAARMLNLK